MDTNTSIKTQTTSPTVNNTLQSTNILETSYEPHDRALYFHITKMGYTYTEREPWLLSTMQ